MFKLTVLLVGLCIVLAQSSIYADLYALRLTPEGLPGEVIAIDFESGFKVLVDLSVVASNFTTFRNLTYYDANAESFIVGNSDPPMLALVNTFNSNTKVIKLPSYGKLLSLTSYDGTIYVLLGLDEDLPNLGSVVGYDISTGDSSRLAKFKINAATQSFIEGSTLVWLPHIQAWLFEVQDMETQAKTLWMVNNSPTPTVYQTQVPGGWQSMWFDVNTDNTTVLAYYEGAVTKINVQDFSWGNLTNFDCTNGALAVNFQKQMLYQFANCDGLVSIESFSWFYNKSYTPVDLDPNLENIQSIQSVGTYIPFMCGQACGTHPDCALSKTCNTCRLGKCTPDGQCNSFCLGQDDCYSGVCVGNCENNRCGKRGCGMKCNNHDECESNSQTCTICRLGQCVDTGGCGAYCITPLDCYAGGCTNNCQNWRCAQPS